MRALLSALALASVAFLTPDASAQTARQTTASRADIVVVPALPGEAVRLTTARRMPTARQSLRRYRGLRVYRPTAGHGRIVQGQAVMPIVTTARGERFVQRGGSHFYAGGR